MAFLDEIAFYIEQQGLAAPPPVQGGIAALRANLFDEAGVFQIAIQETGGTGQMRHHSQQGVAAHFQTVQVAVRAATQVTARERAQALWNAFNGKLRSTALLGTHYLALDVEGPVFFLQRDENERYYFAFNARAFKEPS